MGRRRASVVILCEDRQQEVFIRRALREEGYDTRKIRVKRPDPGSQSAEQYVRERYPGEVRAQRTQSQYRTVSLVTMIDADTRTVEERHQDLEEELHKHRMPRREPTERIAVLVPKRNIETWIHYLFGNAVDEATEYPKLKHESECQPAVVRFVEICKPGASVPDDCPPSLQRAREEWQRIATA